jgi:hypothetical protein
MANLMISHRPTEMTKPKKRKLIATFTGREAQALHNYEAEITGSYVKSKGVYTLYMTFEADKK